MDTLNEKLKDIYMTYKDHENPPVPLDTIKEFLELEGISLEVKIDINPKKSSIEKKESIGGNEFE